MKLNDKHIVITGAASGIGKALAIRFAQEKPRGLVLVDLHDRQQALDQLAAALSAGDEGHATPAIGVGCNVTDESEVQALVARAEKQFGPIDLFCSNAGVIRDGTEQAPNSEWDLNWQVHVMAHVYAARAVLPGMRARGEGYLLNTASAAGLITSLPSATYAVSKHAAIAFAEWVAIHHGDAGVKVSVLCPQAVDTPMIQGRAGSSAARNDGVISAAELAECVVRGLDEETFLIVPHPQVVEYFQRKAAGYDRWISGMRRFAASLTGGAKKQ